MAAGVWIPAARNGIAWWVVVYELAAYGKARSGLYVVLDSSCSLCCKTDLTDLTGRAISDGDGDGGTTRPDPTVVAASGYRLEVYEVL